MICVSLILKCENARRAPLSTAPHACEAQSTTAPSLLQPSSLLALSPTQSFHPQSALSGLFSGVISNSAWPPGEPQSSESNHTQVDLES